MMPTISLAKRNINSSAIVWDFLAFASFCATKYEASVVVAFFYW
jgi:hypothetical protein